MDRPGYGAPAEAVMTSMDRQIDISRLVLGDKDEWDAFVDLYSPVVYSAVRKTYLAYAGSAVEADVDDAAQEVFVKLVRNDFGVLGSYSPAKSSLVTWLTVIARNTTIDGLRKRRIRTVPLDDERDDEAVPPAPPPTPVEIPRGLLSPRQELVLGLFFDRGLDVKEIAVLLGVKEQTVRSARHKALNKLRKYFRKCPADPPREGMFRRK